MTLDEVRKALRSYHTASARVAFLKEEAEELRRGIELEKRPELHAIHAQSYTGAPTTKSRSSITERTALRAADGYRYEDVQRWEAELRQIEAEIRSLERYPRYVDIWLSALTDKERAVITAHEIELQSWEEMASHSAKLLGVYYSVSGLRKIGRTAMMKITDIAR